MKKKSKPAIRNSCMYNQSGYCVHMSNAYSGIKTKCKFAHPKDCKHYKQGVKI